MLRDLFLSFSLFLICGCATAPIATIPLAPQEPGVYHRVVAGQTLWRISQMYDVDLDRLVAVNRIPDAARIEKGQLIFIPGASHTRSEAEVSLPLITSFSWPVRGKIVGYFGSSRDDMINKGIDVLAGSAEYVVASAEGRVTFCDYLRGYGNTIILEHAQGISTVYAADMKPLVKVSDRVAAKTAIGHLKAAGRNPVVHFELRRGVRPQNPLYYLP